jgi:hypothetical protein
MGGLHRSAGLADGGFRGEGLLAGVAALVNDTRSSPVAGSRTPHLHTSHVDLQVGDDHPAAGPP